MSQNGKIIVFSEEENLCYELLAAARPIANKLNLQVGVICLKQANKEPSEYIYYGADIVYNIQDFDLKQVNPDQYVQLILSVINQVNPEVILIGGSKIGKEITPRVATRLNVSSVSDCLSLNIDEEKKILSSRMIYGGNSNIILTSLKKPFIVSLKTKVFEKIAKDNLRKGEVVEFKAQIEESKVKIVERIDSQKGDVNIRNSQIIVSIGRGLKKQEDLDIIKELSNLLGGTIGGSRPIVEDFKWLPKERQVGLSGETVKPNLYVAVGISGQIHHIVGMKDSRVIVAVNSDEGAPIFEACDYGVVGDLYQVIPELIKILKSNSK